ncbi:MAG: PRC-barrel domain-containing protein [Actinobacteria bacterium]|nr:PRC-barrel domain-containing protein [Actinomycetota bacterium]
MSYIDISQLEELVELEAADVLASDGEKIGELEQVWVDTTNGLPEWGLVKAGKLFGGSRYVPLRAAEFGQGQLKVAYTKDEVDAAPDFDPQQASPEDERALYRHYGQPLPAPPPPQVRNPFDPLKAVWLPGVGEKAAAYGKPSRGDSD